MKKVPSQDYSKKGIINKDRRKRSLLTYTTSLLKSQYIEKSTGKSTSDYI